MTRRGALSSCGASWGLSEEASLARCSIRPLVFQLQAQTALCQVAIETNTRRAADAMVAAASPPEAARLTRAG